MLTNRLLRAIEARTGENMQYAREIASARAAAFWRFAAALPLVRHRGKAPPELFHLARIGAMQVEDCGECLQTVVDEARAAGLDIELIRTALRSGDELSGLHHTAYLFGRLVAGEASADEGLRERLEAAIGRAGLVDVTVGAAAVRIFPALKRGLGYARSCSVVRVDAAGRDPGPPRGPSRAHPRTPYSGSAPPAE